MRVLHIGLTLKPHPDYDFFCNRSCRLTKINKIRPHSAKDNALSIAHLLWIHPRNKFQIYSRIRKRVLEASGADILFVCLDVSVLSVFNNNVRLVVQDKSFGSLSFITSVQHLSGFLFVKFVRWSARVSRGITNFLRRLKELKLAFTSLSILIFFFLLL